MRMKIQIEIELFKIMFFVLYLAVNIFDVWTLHIRDSIVTFGLHYDGIKPSNGQFYLLNINTAVFVNHLL